MIWLFVGLTIGIQVGYWASSLHLWAQEVLVYLGAIRKQRRGIPAPRLIMPDGEQSTGPSIVKPKSPRQIRIEQVDKIRKSGL